MGLALKKIAPWIDVIVSGEGEQPFLRILRKAEGNSSRRTCIKKNIFVADNSMSTQHDLDALPIPNYADYFSSIKRNKIEDSFFRAEVPFETARGCWWGEKHHCTFCGLNGQGMPFRSKSPDRVLGELRELSRRHPKRRFAITDNILDMKYFKTLLPSLAKEKLLSGAFWEIKANVTFTHLKLLRDAGISRVQPGIESFSSHALSLMKKGVRPIQNIQLLVDCQALGIEPGWNVLWGFPGETAEEYTERWLT
jgi:ribosomal peptide maturation radical SAM protein 1